MMNVSQYTSSSTIRGTHTNGIASVPAKDYERERKAEREREGVCKEVRA
jgi:hypothetical protein